LAEIVRRSVADQNWESQHDPRHRGQINVLLFGGSVVAHDPETIDPRVCRPFVEYWRPMRDHGIMLVDCTEGPSTSTGGTGGGGGGTDDDGGTNGDSSVPPDESNCACYEEEAGFPEVLTGHYLKAHLCPSDTSGRYPPFIDIPLDASHERVRMEDRTANSYVLNFEDWLDWDWSDHLLRFTRESNGDITICYVRDGAGYEASLYNPPFGSGQLTAPGVLEYVGMLPNPFMADEDECALNPVGTCATIPGNIPGRCLNVVAGPSLISAPNAPVSLDGDLLATTGGPVTVGWHKVSGPGTVTFSSPNSEDTSATFSAVGTYTLRMHATDGTCNATDDVTVTVNASGAATARYVRVEQTPAVVISLGEVEVYDAAGTNHALAGTATHISTRWGGEASRAIDGDNNCDASAGSFSHSGGDGPHTNWWEVDLGQPIAVALVRVTTRCDAGWGWNQNMQLQLLDASRNVVWTAPVMNPNGVDPVFNFFPQ
jgi:hypothetical protein